MRATRKPTRFLRGLPAPLPASFFVSSSRNTLLLPRFHPFVRGCVIAREPRVIAVARRSHLGRGRWFRYDRRSSRRLWHRFIDPIGGVVAGCGIGGRAVERLSLLAPACPSGALAVIPTIRKPGSRSCDWFIPREAKRFVWLTALRAASYWAFSLLLSMGGKQLDFR